MGEGVRVRWLSICFWGLSADIGGEKALTPTIRLENTHTMTKADISGTVIYIVNRDKIF